MNIIEHDLPIHLRNFKKIKKIFGEDVAKSIRSSHPILLSHPEFPEIIKFAGKDIIEPKNTRCLDFLLNKLYPLQTIQNSNKSPLELLNEAGYDAFIADTREKQDSIREYFRPHEVICTIGETHRFEDFYIIHAVKKNAKQILPKEDPDINDEYATSVISIQLSKSSGRLSKITNRYNDTLSSKCNPDETFGCCPDNIIPGLTASLGKYFFGKKWQNSYIYLPGTYKFNDKNNKLIHYNIEYDMNNMIGDGFYVKDNKIIELKKIGDIFYKKDEILKNQQAQEMLLDDVLLKIYRDKPTEVDGKMVSGKFVEFVNPLNPNNTATTQVFNEEIADKTTIRIIKNKDKTQSIYFGKFNEKNELVETEFATVKDSKIIKLNIEKTKELPDNFLKTNTDLQEINLQNVEKIGNLVLNDNISLEKINLSKCKAIGSSFLCMNKKLKEIDLPELINIGGYCFAQNEIMEKANLPKVKNIGDDLFLANTNIHEINLMSAEIIGSNCLRNNKKLKILILPNAKRIERGLLYNHPKTNGIKILVNKNTLVDNYYGINKIMEYSLDPQKKIGFEQNSNCK